MSFPNDEVYLNNIYNPSSRSELLHQLSIHSSNTAFNGRRSSSRVTKPSSASNSPHYIQRRRTTANHSIRAHSRITPDNQYQTREQRLRHYYDSQQPAQFTRPMSWHPGSDNTHNVATQTPTAEPALGNTIVGLENLAVDNPRASSVQQSFDNTFAMGYGHPNYEPTTTYDMMPAAFSPQNILQRNQEPSYEPYPVYSISDHIQCPCIPRLSMHNGHTNNTHFMPEQWTQASSGFQNPESMTQAMPPHSSGLGQTPSEAGTKPRTFQNSKISSQKSKDLVGMGLYDDKISDFMLNFDSINSQNSIQDSLGKGLKLEETWQPPNEDEDEDEEDGDAYSTDEVDETEDAPPNTMSVMPSDPQKALHPAHGDLSNQSFFFEDDDYNNDNQYTNFLTYNQGLQESEVNGLPNHGMFNYMWQ